ncbi:MAG: hypothetical protein ACRDGM_08465 [bacterium]
MTYQGQIMSWMVEACRKSFIQVRCAASSSRTLRWPLPPPAWQPVSSIAGPTAIAIYRDAAGRDVLGLSFTDVFGADNGYLVCLATTNSGLSRCPQSPSINAGDDPFVRGSTVSWIEIPLSQLRQFSRQRVKVIAAACQWTVKSQARYNCVYQRTDARLETPLP